MSIFEIATVITTILCVLMALVPFAYGIYRFHYRVKIRGTKQMKGLFPRLQARWPDLVGTPLHFVVTTDHVKVRLHASYSPASTVGFTFARTGDMHTRIEAEVVGQGCPLTVRHQQARPTVRDQQVVSTPTELPADFLMESTDPERAATLWTPTARAAAAHVRGWRIDSDGKTVSATSARVPMTVEELEAIIDLVTAFATAVG